MDLETLLHQVVGENYQGTMAILIDEEIDVEAFYALDSDTLREISKCFSFDCWFRASRAIIRRF